MCIFWLNYEFHTFSNIAIWQFIGQEITTIFKVNSVTKNIFASILKLSKLELYSDYFSEGLSIRMKLYLPTPVFCPPFWGKHPHIHPQNSSPNLTTLLYHHWIFNNEKSGKSKYLDII
jgi:hypothetical protein